MEQYSRESNKSNRKLMITFLIVFIIMFAVLISAVLLDSEGDNSRFIPILAVISVLMFIFTAIGLTKSFIVAKHGENLSLPFGGAKDAAAEIINSEVASGRILVDEYNEIFPANKKPHGERVMLTPSYLLLLNGRGKATAIPKDKIYAVCPQPGIKGRSSYIARLIVFTEDKAIYFEGAEQIEVIANKLYEYIPNYFGDCDMFVWSYKLDELYNTNRQAFLQLYEDMKQEYCAHDRSE